jgi:hypothetical protein
MEVEQAVYQRLAATAALTALVGDRIFPDEADPDAVRPMVVYTVVSTNEDRDIDGAIHFSRHTVNIWCEDETFAGVKGVAVAINTALDRQAFAGVKRAYRQDYQTADADDGRFEALQTYLVIQ